MSVFQKNIKQTHLADIGHENSRKRLFSDKEVNHAQLTDTMDFRQANFFKKILELSDFHEFFNFFLIEKNMSVFKGRNK